MHNIKVKEMFCKPAEERALINYCMNDLTNYFAVCSKLEPKDFLYSQHEMIMMLFAKLASKGVEKFELNMLIAEATAEGVLESLGGIQYLQTISNINVAQKNFDVYLSSVFEAATKYKLYSLMTGKVDQIEQNAKDGVSSSDLLSSVEADILDLSMSGLSINEPINLGEGLAEYIEELKDKKIELSGVSTGYPILDKQIDGMVPGTLQVIAARKKMGKSTFLTNIALHVAYRLRLPVLYVDTELSFNEWRSRALAAISGVRERDIKHGNYDTVTCSKLTKILELVEKGKLFHEYMPGYSVDKLVALYKKYHYKEKIGLIVFDYLKEPDSTSVDRQRKEYQLLGDVTTKLKDLAGQLNIPALTAVQLNRDNDVADSDRIARYADIVCHWGVRDAKEIEEGGLACGSHKLEIRDTRRGGATSDKGIGYKFFKDTLSIKEVAIDKQYFGHFDKVVNHDSASYEGYEDEELS